MGTRWAVGGYTSGMRDAGAPRFGEWVIPGLVAAVETARLIAIERMPEREMMGYIPDDAFYYLVMGRNFARLGKWTFDGVAPATGFHLAWGYLIAAVYAIDPGIGLHAMFLVAGVFQIACVTVAVWLVGRTAQRWFGAGTGWGVAVVFLSSMPLGEGISLMETALVLVMAAATVDLLCRTEAVNSRGMLVWAAALGFAGMTARSDYGVLPFCLFAMQLAMLRWGASSGAMVRRAGAVFAGAVAGLAVIALHTHAISGGWMQSSVRMKLQWSHSMGFSMAPAGRLLLKMLSVAENTRFHSQWVIEIVLWSAWVLPLVLLAGVGLKFRQSWPAQRVLLAGLGFALMGYMAVYTFDRADVQNWYVGNLEAPAGVLAGAAASWFCHRRRALTTTAAAAFCLYGVMISFRPPAPWQALLYDGGMYLRTHPEAKPAGAWNAGILGYLAQGGVTNLDGLVNDDIPSYVETGTLARYVEARGLRSLVDYTVMLAPPYSTRGGYDDGELFRCVVADRVLDPPRGQLDQYNPVRVFHLKPGCLSKR